MYAPFFGLSKEPFSIAPDPRFLFMSEQHREALAHLLYGLGGGGGFVLLTGEIGAGKTTVCRCFLEQVPAHCAVAYIFNPKLTAIELLQTVCVEFGVALPVHADSVKAHVDVLNSFLLAAHAQGRQAVLVIDEAQSLSADVLEQLRLLTNLETAERKLLQIVLIGQPELRDMLARPELEQLAQRVTARYHLGALNLAQTQQYIRHRLSVAGSSANLPFDEAAMVRIHQLSGGVPRRINLLADRALLGAYSQSQARADKSTVAQAAREVFAQKQDHHRPGWPWAVALALALLLAGAAWWVWLQRAQGPGKAVERAVLSQAAQPATRAEPAASAAPTAATVVAHAASAAPASTAASAAGSAAAPLAALSALSAAASTAIVTATSTSTATATGSAAIAQAAIAQAAPSTAAAVWAAARGQSSAATAWRELALLWNVAIGEGDPCVAVAQAQLACFRSATGGLPVVRQLARPGWLRLHAPNAAASDNKTAFVLLLALDDGAATLQVGRERLQLSLTTLAQLWRGEFATYWHTPPGWREGQDASADPALRAWLEQQLAAAGVDASRPLRERLRAYQLAQGLPPDGRAGPMTFMILGKDAGTSGTSGTFSEPRLTLAR
jgi:general secretion pathway protein A